MNIKLIRKGDIILALCIAVLCAAIWGLASLDGGGLTAVITVDGSEYKTVNLNNVESGYTLELDTEPAVIVGVDKGAIWFAGSGCPDKLCVKAGKLTHRGSAAACLPAKTVITITGKGAVDAETY